MSIYPMSSRFASGFTLLSKLSALSRQVKSKDSITTKITWFSKRVHSIPWQYLSSTYYKPDLLLVNRIQKWTIISYFLGVCIMKSENEEISKQINKLGNIGIDMSKTAEEKVSAINQLLSPSPLQWELWWNNSIWVKIFYEFQFTTLQRSTKPWNLLKIGKGSSVILFRPFPKLPRHKGEKDPFSLKFLCDNCIVSKPRDN